jgi:uncharacterized protein
VELPLYIILIIFLASTVFCTFGFGDALLAMPFLSLSIGVQQATPLMALTGFTLAILLLSGSIRQINKPEAARLVIGSLLGVPIGVLILKYGNEQNIRIAVGAIIIAVALYNLLRPSLKELESDASAPVFGFVGGILAGAFNTSAPPVVMYGTMRRWSPAVFVGMMQAYFIPTDIFVIAGHLKSGLLNETVLRMYVLCVPFLLAAVFLGNFLKKRIPTHKFYHWIFLLILASGVLLVVRSLQG